MFDMDTNAKQTQDHGHSGGAGVATQERKPTAKPSQDPVVAMGMAMYKNLTMSVDATVNLLSKVKNEHIKTGMTAALCFYEKKAGDLKKILSDRNAQVKEESGMTKAMAHMGIVMNTALDATDSHIAQMLIEGSTMLITETVKLKHEYENCTACHDLVTMADEITTFEQGYMEKTKEFL